MGWDYKKVGNGLDCMRGRVSVESSSQLSPIEKALFSTDLRAIGVDAGMACDTDTVLVLQSRSLLAVLQEESREKTGKDLIVKSYSFRSVQYKGEYVACMERGTGTQTERKK
jgi:hypothetical protein